MSLLRKLKKAAKKRPAWVIRRAKLKSEAGEFEAERRKLFKRLSDAARECGERSPVKFLEFLKQQRRGYDPTTDGASRLMQLVDDISALDALEQEWVKANEPKEPTNVQSTEPDSSG